MTSCLWPVSNPLCCRWRHVLIAPHSFGVLGATVCLRCVNWKLQINWSISVLVGQVEGHPYLAQVELLAHCRDRGLVMTAYSPLGSPDRAWKHPDEPVLLQEPVIASLAEKYNKSLAQIVLRWFHSQMNWYTLYPSVDTKSHALSGKMSLHLQKKKKKSKLGCSAVPSVCPDICVLLLQEK